jgi:hypothetical protein
MNYFNLIVVGRLNKLSLTFGSWLKLEKFVFFDRQKLYVHRENLLKRSFIIQVFMIFVSLFASEAT